MQNFMTKGKSELIVIMNSHQSKLSTALFALLLILTAQVFADSRTQAKRMHDRLTGVAPSPAVLNSMEALLDTGNSADAVEAAYIAMNNKHFYNATLVNLITP